MSRQVLIGVAWAYVTENRLQRAYINAVISQNTAEEAMILGTHRWSKSAYPAEVIADTYYAPESSTN